MATQGRGRRIAAMDRGSVVRRLYDSFAAWDMEAVAGSLSDDVVFQMPGTGANAGDHRGRVAGEPRLLGGTFSERPGSGMAHCCISPNR